MTPDAQVALVVGIVAAAAALAGALGATITGWFLGQKSAVRAEKRAAFVELLAALDNCQHVALHLQQAMLNKEPTELRQQRDLMRTALSRVDTACSIAVLSLEAKHEGTIRAAMTASVEEYTLAVRPEKYATVIPAAWKAIVALGRNELK
jgi:hypothetical protein